MREKKLFLLIPFLIVFFSFLPSGSVVANQYGITIGATAEVSGSATVYIPAGTYHVYITIDASLGSYGSAICTSDILAISTEDTFGTTKSWESALTVNQSKDYIFTAVVNASVSFGYYANFAVVLTDLDIITLTKTSIIGSAFFSVEFVIFALVAVGAFYVKKRKG